MSGMGSWVGRKVLGFIEGNDFTLTACVGCIWQSF